MGEAGIGRQHPGVIQEEQNSLANVPDHPPPARQRADRKNGDNRGGVSRLFALIGTPRSSAGRALSSGSVGNGAFRVRFMTAPVMEAMTFGPGPGFGNPRRSNWGQVRRWLDPSRV